MNVSWLGNAKNKTWQCFVVKKEKGGGGKGKGGLHLIVIGGW